jgi:hypothetical protein
MIETLLEVMMGKTGRYLLDLYQEYHLLINIIVITYGVSLVWAHMNLREMVHEMEKLILKVAASLGSAPNPEEIFTTFAKEWQEVPEKQRVLIPTRTDLWMTMIARKEMVNYLGIRPDYVRVVLSKAGLISEDGGLEKQEYRVWERYRHQLLTGVRARHLEPDYQLKLRNKQNQAKVKSPKANKESK